MGRFLSFWWLCVRTAFRGNAPFANDWQWLLGYPLMAGALWILGYFYAGISGNIQVTLTTGALGILAAAFGAFVITWTISFLIRFANAPAVLYNAERARADSLRDQLAELQEKMNLFEGSIPIAHAPFDLIEHPELSNNASFWTVPILEQQLSGGIIDKPPVHSEMKWNVGLPQYKDKWGYDLILCKIDFPKRQFRWAWGPSEKHGRGFSCSPWFIANCPTFVREGLSEEGWQEIVRHTNFTWTLMCGPIWELIEAKNLVLWGRVGSPTASFSQIPPDSWRHFKVTDWERGQAATETGDRIFSLHVAEPKEIKDVTRKIS